MKSTPNCKKSPKTQEKHAMALNETLDQQQPAETQAEIQATPQGVHIEISIPWKQLKRISRPLGLTLTHLITAGLTAISINHTLLNPVLTVPTPLTHPAQPPSPAD